MMAFDYGRLMQGRRLLQPLLKKHIPSAILLGACHPGRNMTNASADAFYIAGVRKAAKMGHPSAIYLLGAAYDMGDGLTKNTLRAARLFKIAADRGHARSQWIHAIDLLWGKGHYPVEVEGGLRYLAKAVASEFDQAYELLARFHESGEFGFEINADLVAEYRALAEKPFPQEDFESWWRS
jgi:uncharacterized protein